MRTLNRLFDWLYHSEYNPLYRSGTLAVGLLVLLLVTGLYLVCFYSVGDPYGSVSAIQDQVFLGRWIRTVHRYASDLVLVAVVFHVLQLLLQRKTWGPRVLAWLSGVVLLGVLLLSVYSGYVMVWDKHGEQIAIAGAKLLSVFPFLRSPLGQAFSGLIPIPASFFFVNLFLHVALPLCMIFALWVHTARLSRSVWFPPRPILRWTIFSLISVAVVWPAPLIQKADLAILPGRMAVDFFYTLFIPVASTAPYAVWAFVIICGILLASVPWWWKPKVRRPNSVVDVEACSGCTQCADDCPYEAITMHPRSDGRRLVASVEPSLCVSCGLCAASCSDLAIGPPGRTGREELQNVESFIVKHAPNPEGVVVIHCIRTADVAEKTKEVASGHTNYYPFDCCGTCNTQVFERLLSEYGGVFLLGCPERNCMNRDGFEMLRQRMFEKRVPFLDRSIDRGRIMTVAHSIVESKQAQSELSWFEDKIKKRTFDTKRHSKSSNGYIFRRVVATSVILLGTAALSQYPIGEDPKHSLVRIAGSLTGQSKDACHKPSAEELKNIPKHMQSPLICETRRVTYDLKVYVDSEFVFDGSFAPAGARGDAPIFVNQEIPVSQGEHSVKIEIQPQVTGGEKLELITHEHSITVAPGDIRVIKLTS